MVNATYSISDEVTVVEIRGEDRSDLYVLAMNV